jgi:hypothetical protein
MHHHATSTWLLVPTAFPNLRRVWLAVSTHAQHLDSSEFMHVTVLPSFCNSRDHVFARGLLRVREYLSAGQDNTMCLICLGAIKPTEAVWQCGSSCYAQFHLPCIQVGRRFLDFMWSYDCWNLFPGIATAVAILRTPCS